MVSPGVLYLNISGNDCIATQKWISLDKSIGKKDNVPDHLVCACCGPSVYMMYV
jgi:hypothetical protein